MKKIMLAAVATCAVVAFLPASALAQRHSKHHRRAHHHVRVHHKKFGTDPTAASTTPSTTPPNTSPSPGQGAGTIQSFTGGVLTIMLNDGTTVSGQVTQDTEIKCISPQSSSGMDSGSSGMDSGSGWRGHHEGDFGGGGSDQGGNNDQGDNDQDDQGDNDDQNQVCDMTSLTAGTVVLEAELNISSAGAVWEKVVIMTTPTSTAPSTAPSTSGSTSSGSDDD